MAKVAPKIIEKSGVAYLSDEKLAHKLTDYLQKRDGTTPGWLTSDVWPKAQHYGAGWGIQIRCSGPYLNRDAVRKILEEMNG